MAQRIGTLTREVEVTDTLIQLLAHMIFTSDTSAKTRPPYWSHAVDQGLAYVREITPTADASFSFGLALACRIVADWITANSDGQDELTNGVLKTILAYLATIGTNLMRAEIDTIVADALAEYEKEHPHDQP